MAQSIITQVSRGDADSYTPCPPPEKGEYLGTRLLSVCMCVYKRVCVCVLISANKYQIGTKL